jgi:hypothetical protein
MWLHLVKTFFVGQVVIEQTIDAIKKQSFKQKVEAKVDDLQHKVEELKSEGLHSESLVKVRDQFENNFKDNVAVLRKSIKPFDHACDSLAVLLGETAERKEALLNEEDKAEELVTA